MNIEVKTTSITPEMAQMILDTCAYQHQRGVSRTRVLYYIRLMQRGEFSPTQTIAFARNGAEKQYLINGQHTLLAIVESGVTLNLPVHTHRVQNDDEIADLYAHYDRGRARTAVDSASVRGWAEKLEISPTTLNRYVVACKFVLSDFKSGRSRSWNFSDHETEQALFGWKDQMREYLAAVGGTLFSRMTRGSVFSVGLVTYKHQPEKAAQFWYKVATDDGLELGDVRKLLYRHISSTVVSGASRSDYNTIQFDYDVRAVARVWNAFYDGEALKLLKVINTRAPVVIKGTPYGE